MWTNTEDQQYCTKMSDAQKFLLSLSEETLEEVSQYFKDSSLFSELGSFQATLHLISSVAFSRPFEITLYIKLILSLKEMIIPMKDTLPKLFPFNEIFLYDPYDYRTNQKNLFLLLSFYQMNLIKFDDFIKKYGFNITDTFAPEMYQYVNTPGNEQHARYFSYMKLSSDLKYHEFIKENRINGIPVNDPIAVSIFKDDLNELQQLMSNPVNKYDMKVELDTYLVFTPIIVNKDYYYSGNSDIRKCSLLQYSAFCGSVKCFRYLILNNVNFDKDSLMRFAIAGGNTEIIKICESKDCAFQNVDLDTAIIYHRNEIARWINEYMGVKYSASSIGHCILGSNYELFKEIIDSVSSEDILTADENDKNSEKENCEISKIKKLDINSNEMEGVFFCFVFSNLIHLLLIMLPLNANLIL